MTAAFTPTETKKLETYLRKKLSTPNLTLKSRPQAPDSVEFLIDGELLGTVYKDTDEGETSYDVNISVLEIDLDDAA